jgi:hypothetical protein
MAPRLSGTSFSRRNSWLTRARVTPSARATSAMFRHGSSALLEPPRPRKRRPDTRQPTGPLGVPSQVSYPGWVSARQERLDPRIRELKMNPGKVLARLVQSTYGAPERARFCEFEPTAENDAVAAEAGRAILAGSLPIAGACTYLTAAWALRLRTEHELPVCCVAGDLQVRGRWAFRTSGSDISRQFDESNDGWSGHCWIQLGRHKIGDLSLCRTAYRQPDGSNLKAAVLDAFGSTSGLFILRRGVLVDARFEYQPKYVLSDEQMAILVQSARDIGRLQ